MRFVCSECGHSVEAAGRPAACPACEAPAARMWALDGDAEAVLVTRSGRRRWLLVLRFVTATVLCLIPTPLFDELVHSPVVEVAADGSPERPAVEPVEGSHALQDPAVSEIDRLAPGTVAAWRKNGQGEGAAPPSGGAGGAAAPGVAAGGRPPAPSGSAPAPGPGRGEPEATGRSAAEVVPGTDGRSASAADGVAARSCQPESDPPRAVVFIVDASVSMGLPVDIPVEVEHMLDARIDAGDEEARSVYRQLMAGPSPKRLDFAKQVFAAAIDRIPPGFDAGLVSFRSCTRVDDMGPVKPADFGALRAHVDALAVQRGGDTAISESLTHARRLLKGSGGRVLLVTDGQETCHRDPCVVHSDIAGDGIVVDIVDLTGTAVLECLARSSGGQVYRSEGSLEVDALTRFVTAAMDRACTGN